MIDERSIAKRIREERRKAGISQDCLGKRLGVDGFYISKLENNTFTGEVVKCPTDITLAPGEFIVLTR